MSKHSQSEWFVSRQNYWGVESEDALCVEIAFGGIDYSNADMLAAKYIGEGESYTNPIEAVEVAIKIRDNWNDDLKKSGENVTARVDKGSTGGMGIPFLSERTDEELRAWARETLESLPKCDECGDLLGTETYTHSLNFDDDRFCSSYCAERAYDGHFAESDEEAQDQELIECN